MTANLDATRWDAVLFDLDGVVTDTASVHDDAWRKLLDDFLAGRARRNRFFHDRLRRSGLAVFDSTVQLVHDLAKVDGEVAARLDLPGKPDPAMLLEHALEAREPGS